LARACAWNGDCSTSRACRRFAHEIYVELFRQRPALAGELLAACAGIRLGGVTVERASIDLSQVAPAEYRSDAVSVLRDHRRAAVAAVIAEVQLAIDDDKRFSWPLYVAAARASLRCPVTLLVLAPGRAVARWARRPIPLGHPGHTLQPIVVGFERIPRVTDAARARAAPQLAVLSALAHPQVEIAEAALTGIDGLPEDDQKLYWDVILNGLPALVRRALEARMIKGYEYQSDFARKYYGQGKAEGKAEGREEAREALRREIVELVGARLPGLRAELASRLRQQPESALVRVTAELAYAADEKRARAILDRVLGQSA
jgi:hypothetical protein